MTKRPRVRLTQEERKILWDAMPDGLPVSQQAELFRDCEEAIDEYVGLREQRIGREWPGAQIELVKSEIRRFRQAVEKEATRLPKLSEDALRWTLTFGGPDAADVLERPIREPARAVSILAQTEAGLAALNPKGGRPTDYAALIAGVQFAEKWKRFIRGTSYRYTDNHGPFSLMFRAIIRVARRDPSYDGAKDARAIHAAIQLRLANDAAANDS